MAGIKIEKYVEAPSETVFDYATDFANCAEYIDGIHKTEMLTEGPVGVGTRFRETRLMFKKEAVEEMEVTAFERPRGYTLACENHGARYASEFILTPQGSGTNLSMSFEATPLTMRAKILGFLMRPMMKMMAKECLKDLDGVKRAAEAAVASKSS